MEPRRTVFTSAAEIRAVFNSEVLLRVESGEIQEHVRDTTDPSRHSNQPPGAVSQTVLYFLGGEAVAQAHRFVLKDGSVGASGLPDPKWVVHEGVVLLGE